ncbi:MAG: hypothetical protein ACK5PF_09625 [bacterium]
MSAYSILVAAREILKAELERERARSRELEAERDAARADAERLREACNYALAAHYGRLSPMHNHWAAVIEKAMVQDTKSDAARGKE